MSAKFIVVSDATPLIALAKIGGLAWLPELFGEVIVPDAVYREVVIGGVGRSGSEEIRTADWIQVRSVRDRGKVERLLNDLDIGEAEAIALAQEMSADWLLLDEIRARTVAKNLELPVIGTVGLLRLAKQEGLVTSVKPLLDALLVSGFRLSKVVYESILKQVDES
ncbi:MAG: DUF3368 domain-containing protein [Chloroflexi bacterium]|nr:DUF3368 domain-containing protein [Chloroflexota bacterium]